MKNKGIMNVSIEYGKENLKEIITELLKDQYINYLLSRKEWTLWIK